MGEDRDLHPVVEVEFAQQTRDVGLTVASLMNNDLSMSAFDRPVATATSTDRPISTTPVRPQWLGRLFDVELRKTVDTRAGRLMIATVLLLASAIATWASLRTWGSADNQLLFGDVLRAVTLLLPAVGVLAMTSEWSQRTALTTFTLSPKRTRVLLCKVGAALLLSITVTAIAVVLTFAGVDRRVDHHPVDRRPRRTLTPRSEVSRREVSRGPHTGVRRRIRSEPVAEISVNRPLASAGR